MTEATADVGFDFFASFGLSLSGLQAEIKRMNDRNDEADARGRAILPRQVPMVRESVNATTTDTLDFDGPQPGRKWEARLLIALSATSGGFVAMATTPVTWYVGQKMSGNAAGILPLAQVRWQFSGIPAFKDLSGDQLVVLPGERLLAGLTSIPAAPTQIMLVAVINDLPLYVGRAVAST